MIKDMNGFGVSQITVSVIRKIIVDTKSELKMWDNCHGCEEKNRDIDFIQKKLDEINAKVDYYYKKGDSSDYYNLIDDIMGILER